MTGRTVCPAAVRCVLQWLAVVPSRVKHVTVTVDRIVYQREVPWSHIQTLVFANHVHEVQKIGTLRHRDR